MSRPPAAETLVERNYSHEWREYGSVDGELYAVPVGAALKSLVWYSPRAFAKAGYAVPRTFDELIALSDRIVADGRVPWCAGIASGESTGWPVTDWLEDVVLHQHGPEVYDRWVAHDIPFDAPPIVDALQRTGTILKNPAHVNAGSATSAASRRPTTPRPACRSLTGTATCTTRPRSTRQTGATA